METSYLKKEKKNDDDIIILLDPDMVLLQPITSVISIPKKDNNKNKEIITVEHGRPIAQKYGLGSRWIHFDLNKITGDENSPSKRVQSYEASMYYPAGPPYLATAHDFYVIVQHWTKFVHSVHLEYPHLLAEMYAYSIAAAHVNLPHVILPSLAVSNTLMSSTEEAWSAIDNMDANQVCFPTTNDKEQYTPYIFHYCQRYMLGPNWFFGKRRIPKNFFSTCQDTYKLIDPPNDLGTLYDYRINPQKQRKDLYPSQVKREAYSLCTMITSMNEATDFYHQHHCPTNFQPETLQLWDLTKKVT